MKKNKIIVNRRLPLWAVPLRLLYRVISKIIPFKNRIRQIHIDKTEYLVWENEDIGKKLILHRKFEEDELNVFKNHIKKGDICIDVGGNIGYYSLNFSKLCGDNGYVYVFEPLKKNALVIQLAAQINSLNNIYVEEAALSNESGIIKLTIPDSDGAYAHIEINTDIDNTNYNYDIPCTTLNEFIKKISIPRVNILKIDVEGAEHLVLLGSIEILANKKNRPRLIMLELINTYLKRFGSSIEEVVEFMSQYGYKPFYAKKNGKLVPYSENDFDQILNVFFLESNSIN